MLMGALLRLPVSCLPLALVVGALLCNRFPAPRLTLMALIDSRPPVGRRSIFMSNLLSCLRIWQPKLARRWLERGALGADSKELRSFIHSLARSLAPSECVQPLPGLAFCVRPPPGRLRGPREDLSSNGILIALIWPERGLDYDLVALRVGSQAACTSPRCSPRPIGPISGLPFHETRSVAPSSGRAAGRARCLAAENKSGAGRASLSLARAKRRETSQFGRPSRWPGAPAVLGRARVRL